MIENYLRYLEGRPLYVAGGAIRDRILKRYSPDIDIVVPSGARELALDFARRSGGTYILLDDEPCRKTERVVVKSHDETLVFDFTKMRGASIEEDLGERDFTINAMALPLMDYLEGSFDSLIDPFGGRDDICKKRIAVISDETFRDDSLRMVRAFRFAAQLGFEIDIKTRKSIVQNRGRLKEVSWERIRDEFFNLLSVYSCAPFVIDMDGLGLLEEIFPEILSMKGVRQNGYHHLDVWGHTLLTLEKIEFVMREPEDYFGEYAPNFNEYLDSGFVPGRSRESIIKFAAIFHDSGKPEARSEDTDGRVRFLGHEDAGKKIAEEAARRLKLSNREIGFVKDMVGDHMYLINLAFLGALSQKSILRFFRKHTEEFRAYFILFLADSMATLGPDVPEDRIPKSKRMTKEMLDIYYGEIKPRIETPPLITGRDLIDKFGLSPDPFLGKILGKVEDARMEGRIKDREEAIRYAGKIIRSKVE
ncbi:MAG: CCA tRNA nucleotidyltransferase [Proteobacteria bacterium]|nr:CCA tRNA nucleotidyltransferase [Pseudomonadota bacterium]